MYQDIVVKNKGKVTMYFFTADEHYNHSKIIGYCNRPFDNVTEMNEELIKRHNEVVGENDITVHCGDFYLGPKLLVYDIIEQLNGQHIFLKGSHDHWLGPNNPTMWDKRKLGHNIVACHYAMRTWPRKHYGSWHVYGHSHGNLESYGLSWDVGVDNNDFYPVSIEQLAVIMEERANETWCQKMIDRFLRYFNGRARE